MKRRIILLILFFMMILYITMGVRHRALTTGSISFTPFMAITRRNHSGILFNILLFIPLGYFSSDLFNKKWLQPFLIVLFSSFSIELIQYQTGLGQFDIDDLICNGIGGLAGIGLWRALQRFQWKKYFPIVLLFAGLIGCVIAPRSSSKEIYTRQFDFHVHSVNVVNGEIEIKGICSIYNRDTLDYELFLDNTPLSTNTTEEQFQTAGNMIDGKHELLIKFYGYDKISTNTYLRVEDGKVTVEYVPGNVDIPFSVPDTYILKAYNPDDLTYVFEDTTEYSLLWYIGWDIDSSTKVIYHIQTNELFHLPDNRIQYGFDNLDFRVGEDNSNELEPVNTEVGMFRVFEREIPDTYNVTSITVGYNTSGNIHWVDCFRVE